MRRFKKKNKKNSKMAKKCMSLMSNASLEYPNSRVLYVVLVYLRFFLFSRRAKDRGTLFRRFDLKLKKKLFLYKFHVRERKSF